MGVLHLEVESAMFRLLDALEGVSWMVASLLYGSGLRLLEALRLRIQDVDFARRELTVRR